MKIGTETGSVVNAMMSGSTSGEVYVGQPATILMWTDRHGATVVAVEGRTVTVQEDKATRTDSNGMSEMQTYDHQPDVNGRRYRFRRNKAGVWKEVGMKSGHGLSLGHKSSYHDFSF